MIDKLTNVLTVWLGVTLVIILVTTDAFPLKPHLFLLSVVATIALLTIVSIHRE